MVDIAFISTKALIVSTQLENGLLLLTYSIFILYLQSLELSTLNVLGSSEVLENIGTITNIGGSVTIRVGSVLLVYVETCLLFGLERSWHYQI